VPELSAPLAPGERSMPLPDTQPTNPAPPPPPELPECAARRESAAEDGRAASVSNLAAQLVELSALTGGLAHEIRNPLSTLKMNLQLLDEDWKQVESADAGGRGDVQDVARRSRRRLAALLAEANHLERILQDFLQYVGKGELRPAPTDLSVLAGDLVEFFQPQAQAHRIDLRFSTPPEPVVCAIDATLMKQAILNLLINAQQAMPDGGSIYLQVGPHGEGLARLDVIDSGPGIPEDQHERIFQAYYSTKKGGTGLGLAMTRKIIREHGGRILVYSSPPTGSCFTILLPRVPLA